MSIKQKLLSIIGLSQLIIIVTLFLVFKTLISDVKNHIQEKRLEDHIDEFSKQLNHREEILKLLSKELSNNPNFKKLLLAGFENRDNFNYSQAEFSKFMKENNLTILEVGDSKGKVLYRFHRPSDYGDDKSKQKIIQEALSGKFSTTLEMGNSGLGLRATTPLDNLGTILLGQTVNREFIREIADFEDVKMVLFNGDKKVASSDDLIDQFISESNNIESNKRIIYKNQTYYLSERIYDSHGFSDLNLKFFVMVNEDNIEMYVEKIWYIFIVVSLGIFLIVSAVAYLFSRDMISAIRSLNFAMKNIEELESHKRLDIQRRDEIGEITKVFVSMKEEIINHQKNLEHTIEKRTSELKDSLREITILKEHQDGDYFLTSQLIKPLLSYDLKSSTLSIKSLINQKKKFSFKKWNSEIGGDLCIVSSIFLKGKEYTVFMNADAMGKSIQGAGGALVMGTVFKSILNRSNWDKLSKDKSPERWIYDCYLDLQSVFLSFDGTMLVSTVIGLIENISGTVFYINADHPRIVLYRDNVASFFEDTSHINKLGLDTPPGDFKISVVQLDDEDSLIIGSDGRDDIMIETEKGLQLNEDENKFLNFVSKSGGDIINLNELLSQSGNIIDDLSLMIIKYIKPQSLSNDSIEDYKKYIEFFKKGEYLEQIKNYEDAFIMYEKALFYYKNDPFVIKKLAKISERNKDYYNTIKYCKEYISINPKDTNYLYIISYYSKITKNFEDSIEFGERFRLREPKNRENLSNLLALYEEIGNDERHSRIKLLIDDLDIKT